MTGRRKAKKKWFKEAIEAKPPYTLGNWRKSQSSNVRRRNALGSRPKNWSLRKRRRSAGQALQALANTTKDKVTKKRAKADADYFFKLLKKMKK